MQRQYSGTAGRIENCQIGVFLAYASAKGRTLLDRELYLPQVWVDDRERRHGGRGARGCCLPDQGEAGATDAGAGSGIGNVPFGWATGDEVYGSDRNLRRWLERAGVPHVLAIKRSEKLWAWTDKGPLQVRADRLASQVDEADWVRCSAGGRGQGAPAVPDWAVVEISAPEGARRRPLAAGTGAAIAKPEELAYYGALSPSRDGGLKELAERRPGNVPSWSIEECFDRMPRWTGRAGFSMKVQRNGHG